MEGVSGLLSRSPHHDRPRPRPRPRCVRERQTQGGFPPTASLFLLCQICSALGFSPQPPRGCNLEVITELSQKQPCAVCWGGGTDGLGEGASQGDRSIRQSAFPELPVGVLLSATPHFLEEDIESREPLRG